MKGPLRRRLSGLLLIAVAPLASSAEPALKTSNCAPPAEVRGDAQQGAALHLKHCAACHGVDGRAEVIVMHMDTPPPDQSDPTYMKTLTDGYLYLAICKGGVGVGKNFIMPAWGDLLSEQDIRDLVAEIRTFSGT